MKNVNILVASILAKLLASKNVFHSGPNLGVYMSRTVCLSSAFGGDRKSSIVASP